MEIIIDSKAQAKIDYWVGICKDEISGMGTIQRNGDQILVTDVFLLKQEVASTSTEITAEAMAKLEYEVIKSGNEDSLNFWWHSHVNMQVFWSGTDHQQMKDFAEHGYIVASVFNKSGQVRSAYRQGQSEFYPSVFVDEIPTSHQFLLTEDEFKELEDDFKAKVTKKVYKAPTGGTNINWKKNWLANQQSLQLNDSDKEETMRSIANAYEQPDFDTLPAPEQKAWATLCGHYFPHSSAEEVEDFYEQYKDDLIMQRELDSCMFVEAEAEEETK